MSTDGSNYTVKGEHNGESFDIVLKSLIKPDQTLGRFPPCEPGSIAEDGVLAERDVAVKMRDGITIYTDIYRPDTSNGPRVPVIVAWSPYGKRYSYTGLTAPGVPPGTHSPGTKFEGPDPDYWVRRGYAIANVDPRGVGNSEGVLQLWTKQEARDEYDFIEWLGAQSWCNGRVGMSGNSYVASSQWYAAAEKPPSLACIAPWEGATDPYRHIFMMGGVPALGQATWESSMAGIGDGEAMEANMALHPMRDRYWQEKHVVLENIEIPAYITGGWSHHYHLKGALEGWRRIKSDKKWLRLHREFEWPDYYTPENLIDLERFFERYLKNRHNGWEMTPKVRVDVMDRADRDHIVHRGETAWPLPDTQYRKLYLDAAKTTLELDPPTESSETSYQGDGGRVVFDHTFERDTELTGTFKLRLWVEGKGTDDFDLFIAVQKADKDGNTIPTFVIGHPHVGALGILRVSHRELDPERSTELNPVQLHLHEKKLQPGEIVPVDIALWPTSRFWHAGERLRLVVSAQFQGEKGWLVDETWDARTKGEHVIHTGGQYDSHLLVPEIPAPRAIIPGASITAAKLIPFADIIKSQERGALSS